MSTYQLAKELLLQTILMSISEEGGIPDREELISRIDGMVVGFPHLKDDRDWLLSKVLEVVITKVPEADELVDPNQYQPWIEKADRSEWSSWPWLKLYLKHRLLRPESVIEELDRSTNRVLDLLGDPNREGLWDRRGLVVGHVQSGKTQHYTALAAKAIDAGYKVIIILSGIHENLRQQTQERIEECLLGKDSRRDFAASGVRLFQAGYLLHDAPVTIGGDGVRTKLPLPDISTLTSVAGDFGHAINRVVDVPLGGQPVVLVIKKNASILRNLLRKVRGPDGRMQFQQAPVLVIDDEADHSSVNAAREDEDPRRINEQIRKLLWCCSKVAFVGYTATPYANIFMDDNWVEKNEAREIDAYGSDLFPRAFIIGLASPSNYIGPESVFGHDGDESIGIPAVSPLPMQVLVEDAEAWLPSNHKNGFKVSGELPASLVTALRCFLLAVAARMAIGERTSHCSMLVHVTRFNSVQEDVMRLIKAYVEGLRANLAGGVDRKELWSKLELLWDREFVAKFDEFRRHPSQIADPPKVPEWPKVKAELDNAFGRMRFTIVNSLTKEGLDFADNKEAGLVVVAVGGDRLSRGLTLEGLMVSYFLRGARAFDTLMQMGRWFGYRPGYTHLCRVFAPQSVIDNFRTISLATEELRREFARMAFLNRTPCQYGLRIREPRGDLMVTALNRMRRGQSVRIHFAESLISSLEFREEDIVPNFEAFSRLVSELTGKVGSPRRVDSKGKSASSGPVRIWDEVRLEQILPFLNSYDACSNLCLDRSTANGKSLLVNYLESVHAHGDLATWTVAILGAAKGEDTVEGLDDSFRAVTRKRLMNEGDPHLPLHSGRVTFKAVAMGQDEAIDLTGNQLEEAEAKYLATELRVSRASLYREMRPSSRGLLLIYPITPSGCEWTGRKKVIGIAVSLPKSEFDSGCDYVCTPQKLREIFGDLSEDLARDEAEAGDLS
jgi:hypothetical protein